MSQPAAGASRAASASTALLVLGMHRSGTSALARVVNLLGAELGGALLPANHANEAGFWEHREIILVHDELLEALGSSWDDPRPLPAGALRSDAARPFRDRLRDIVRRDFSGRALWGLKDPRLCRLVPLWRDLLAETGHDARFLLTARPAAEVAASLRKRDAFAEAKSNLLWLEHQLAAERDTRGARRAFLTYGELLTDWRGCVPRVARALGLDWDAAIDAAAPAIDAFLDPGLRHDRGDGAPRGPEPAWLRATYRAWEEAAEGTDPGPALAAVRDRLDSAGRLFFAWTDVLRGEEERLGALLRDRDAKIAKLRARAAGAASSPGIEADNLPAKALPAAPPPPPRSRPWTNRPGTRVRRTYERPEGNPRVSIVIPLFNKVELTAKCLESLAEHTPDGLYEVILVDNASTDATPQLLDCLEGNVKVVVNEKNLGFAAASNQGAELAGTPNLLFLNNDIEAKAGWLEAMLKVIDADPTVAAVGSRLLFPDGTLQHAGVAMLLCEGSEVPLRAFHAHYGQPADFAEANVPAEYQVLTGACLLVRRGVFGQVGGFDPYYWNGCEDVDLCLKIGEAGWTLVYQPASVLIHHESQSGAERYTRVAGNEQLLCSRWLGKVEPDLIEATDGSRRRTEARRIRAWSPPRGAAAGAAAESGPAGRDVVSIIVLTRNQLEHTRVCFDSLRRHTPEPHEIVFVDNGSTDGTVDWLRGIVRDHPAARAVLKAGNLGFAGGNNQGLAMARGGHVVLLNNDTAVTEGWLAGLMSVLDDHPDVGLVGPMTNRASGSQVIPDVPYRSLPGMEKFARERAAAHAGRSEEAPRLVGFCLLARRRVIDDIGGLDERFVLGNCEDDDFCLRAFQAGWKARIANDVFVHHTGGRTFAAEGVDYARCLAENFDRFKEKWGMDPAARLQDGYPFVELAGGPRRPRIELPVLPLHLAELGGRWLRDKGGAASGSSASKVPASGNAFPLSS
jgi:GT2 family glycosyltransferase